MGEKENYRVQVEEMYTVCERNSGGNFHFTREFSPEFCLPRHLPLQSWKMGVVRRWGIYHWKKYSLLEYLWVDLLVPRVALVFVLFCDEIITVEWYLLKEKTCYLGESILGKIETTFVMTNTRVFVQKCFFILMMSLHSLCPLSICKKLKEHIFYLKVAHQFYKI